jgi:hypothetical protein
MPDTMMAVRTPQEPMTCSSLQLWRDYKTAEKALNDFGGDEDSIAYQELATAFSEAGKRFIYSTDATPLGVLLKLEMVEKNHRLSQHLEDMPHLQWPRILLTLLHDLRAAVPMPNVDG